MRRNDEGVGGLRRKNRWYMAVGFFMKWEYKCFGWKLETDEMHIHYDKVYYWYDETNKRWDNVAESSISHTATFVRPQIVSKFSVIFNIIEIISRIASYVGMWVNRLIFGAIFLSIFVPGFFAIALTVYVLLNGLRLALALTGLILKKVFKIEVKTDDMLWDYGYETFYGT